MRFWFMALMLALLGLAVPVSAQDSPHLTAQLVPESSTPAAGARTTLAILMTPQPGWHGYWKMPGDTGFPMKITWTLPKGTQAGEPVYPVPTTLVIAGLMNHVYEKPYALLVPLDMPAGLTKGTPLPVSAKLDYLVCSASLCVPESATISTALTVGDGASDTMTEPRFDGWRKALPRPLGSAVSFETKNGMLRLAVPLPATVPLSDPHLFVATAGAARLASPQVFSRDGDTLVIETRVGANVPAKLDAVLALGDGSGLSLTAQPGVVPAAGTPLSAAADAGSKHGTLMLALIAFAGAVLGGLILNVMPCVFPILSLKALSLARAGGEERTVRREALAYSVGVILVCVALGGLILAIRGAGSQVGWAFQLQNPAVILILILLTSAIGFNLAGLFELGSVTAGSDLAGKGGVAGAFWTGALAAFIATPCTGPFMAAALGAALVLPTIAALVVFAGLGLGLALPFLALGYIPRLRRCLPKPGGWMETFRYLLAVPMFLTALGLAWVLGHQTDTNGAMGGVLAAMVLAFGLWWTGRRQRVFAGWAWLPATICFCVALAPIALLDKSQGGQAAAPVTATSRPFDEAKLVALRGEGKPVFLYFTADWCLSCKVNEKVAIERAETQAAFRKAGVITMVGDWTDGDAKIGKFLEAHGRSGVPLYLWYAPGKSTPQELPQILTPSLLTGLARS
jgi:thiol:disulfide interchange protein/DsbC/DsbD-like thiol-disulfide interchange protein